MKLRIAGAVVAGALVMALAVPGAGMAATPGQVKEFAIPTAASMPFDILAGPDGNLWFTEQAGVKIGRITPKGKVTDFPIGGGMQPRQLTVGPDKNLWMTDQGANLVYRITPNGAAPPTITAGAALLATPRGIATGPDGDLWIANALGTVQRVKPDGTADGPAIITGGSNLQYITKGADNAMWVTDFNGGLIRIATTPPFPSTPVDIGMNKAPLGITSGPDHKLYFAEAGAAPAGERIGSIRTDGTGFKETKGLSGGASDPEGVAFGRDKNLYAAIFNASQIGQVTTKLKLAQVKKGITKASGPRNVAKGPDGNIWFTEETANKIGRLTPPKAPK